MRAKEGRHLGHLFMVLVLSDGIHDWDCRAGLHVYLNSGPRGFLPGDRETSVSAVVRCLPFAGVPTHWLWGNSLVRLEAQVCVLVQGCACLFVPCAPESLS